MKNIKKISVILSVFSTVIFSNTALSEATESVKNINSVNISKLLKDSELQLNKKNHKAYWHDIKAAANLNSGFAYMRLAQEKFKVYKLSPKPLTFKRMLDDFYRAAEYGYPHAYYLISQSMIYKNKTSSLINECYENLAKDPINADFNDFCMNKVGDQLKIAPNKGFQSQYEIDLNAKSAYQSFCQSDNDHLLSNKYSKAEIKVLRTMICHISNHTWKFQNGDLLMSHSGIKQYKQGAWLVYNAPLLKNQIVYKKNKAFDAYIFDGNILKLAKADTVVSHLGKEYVLDNFGHFKPNN